MSIVAQERREVRSTPAHIVGDQAHRQNGSAHRRYHRCEYTSRCRTIRNGSIAVAGAQVGSTPSVSREVFLSHTSRCSVQFSSARGGGRGRGGARSSARRGARRVSAWAKARGRAALPTLGGLGRYWAAQWHLARAVGRHFRGCRAKRLYLHTSSSSSGGCGQSHLKIEWTAHPGSAHLHRSANVKEGPLPLGL